MPELPGFMKELSKPKDTDKFSAPIHEQEDDDDDEYEDSLVEVPDIRQNDNYSCGAAATMSVGKYFGVGPDSLSEWKTLLGTSRAKSTSPDKIISVLKGFGLQVVDKQDMSIDDLCYYHKLGAPVICPIQEWGDPRIKAASTYGHWVVVVGVGFGYIFVQDPSIDNVLDKEGSDGAKGKMIIGEHEWDEVWHDEGVGSEPYHHYGIAVFPPSE